MLRSARAARKSPIRKSASSIVNLLYSQCHYSVTGTLLSKEVFKCNPKEFLMDATSDFNSVLIVFTICPVYHGTGSKKIFLIIQCGVIVQ